MIFKSIKKFNDKQAVYQKNLVDLKYWRDYLEERVKRLEPVHISSYNDPFLKSELSNLHYGIKIAISVINRIDPKNNLALCLPNIFAMQVQSLCLKEFNCREARDLIRYIDTYFANEIVVLYNPSGARKFMLFVLKNLSKLIGLIFPGLEEKINLS